MIRAAIVTGFAMCMVATAALAESNKTALSTNEFVEKAAAAGATEIEMGKLALQKSSNDSIKKFAQMIVTDHEKAAAELKAVATKEGITVPSTPNGPQKAAIDKLRDEKGADFDRAFATRMVQDHQEAVTLFQKAAGETEMNPAIRQFASTTLPTLQTHFEHSKQLHTTLGAERSSSR